MNHIDGNDQAVITRDANKNALQPLQRAIADSHTLSHGKVRVRAALDCEPSQGSDRLNLRLRNWRRFIARPDKGDYTVGLKYANPGLYGPSGAGKQIARKQREFNDLTSIAPAANLPAYRQECFNAGGFQRILHSLFVPWARPNRVPLSGQEGSGLWSWER
jgi:hypothetical protein